MTVTNVHKDPETRTMRIAVELDATVERAWQLVADPRQLERWWGPPTYPATVFDHDLQPGGRVTYAMNGPGGDTARGWWEVVAVEPPTRLEVRDGFADDEGRPNDAMPTTTAVFSFSERAGGGALLAIETTFASLEDMERLVSMGMEEGITEALGQIDAILASGISA